MPSFLPLARIGNTVINLLMCLFFLPIRRALVHNSLAGPCPPPDRVLAARNPGGLRGEAGDRPSVTREGRTPLHGPPTASLRNSCAIFKRIRAPMLSVKRVGLLIVAGGVAAVIAVVLGVAFYPQDPFRDVAFSTQREEYTRGEMVTFVLVNRGELLFEFRGWRVERLIDGAWVGVECHVSPAVRMALDPGETMTWGWRAETMNCNGKAPVEAGSYRGVASLGVGWESAELTPLFAGFVVV